MVKGLAKHGNRLRHVLRDKCVDASLFKEKSGYSPMTLAFYRIRKPGVASMRVNFPVWQREVRWRRIPSEP